MSETIVVPRSAVEDNPNLAVTHEGSSSRGEPVRNVAPEAEVAESFKTLQLLKEWPVVLFMTKKGQEAYKSVKHSTKLTEIGLNISEKVVTTFTSYSASVIQKLRPVLKLVDYPASEGLVRLQKCFPVVKESPEKIYDSGVERLVKLISPAVNTAVAMTETGRKQVKKITRTVVKSSRKVIALVENRLEEFEKYIAGMTLETAAEPSGEGSTCQDENLPSEAAASTCRTKLQGAGRTALRSAAWASLLSVGACFWLLECLPLVGRCLSEPPTSPSRSRKVSTASSYSSVTDVPAADEAQASPLPPQLSEATQ